VNHLEIRLVNAVSVATMDKERKEDEWIKEKPHYANSLANN
jgi:hypothetical protein